MQDHCSRRLFPSCGRWNLDHVTALARSTGLAPALYNGDDALRFLQERDEARALYSYASRDLGKMHFHLNATQDALSISEHDANIARVKLAESESEVAGNAPNQS